MMPIEQIPAGTKRQFVVDVDTRDEAPPRSIPVTVVVGQRQSPCVAFVAAVHGDEYDGILALQELAREIDPAGLNGSLIIVPVANPFAFDAAQRRTPQDNKDLNRIFPGRADGSLTERLAHALCHEVLRRATLVCTLHGAMFTSVFTPWIEFLDVPGPVGQASYEAARASGFPELVALPNVPGILISAMADLGVPVIEGEVGGRGTMQRENVAYYKDRVYAIARHAGVLSAAGTPPAPRQEPRTWHLYHLTAEVSGILLNEVTLWQDVKKGDRLATMLDLQGDVVAEMHAPRDGKVAGYHEHAGVRPGEIVFSLLSPAQARVYAAVSGDGPVAADWAIVTGPGR